MKGYVITKEIIRDVGDSEPLYTKYTPGSVAVPQVNLYFCNRRKLVEPLTDAVSRSFVVPFSNSERTRPLPDEAMQLVLKIGREDCGDDSFYKQIDVPDETIHEILTARRAIEESPAKLNGLIGQVLAMN